MTIQDFRLLPQPTQLAVVDAQGHYLVSRPSRNGQLVLLHHLQAGFFVEIWFEPVVREVAHVRPFVGGEPLAAWAELVRLPEG